MITGKTTLDVWKQTLKFVFEKGKDFTDEDGRLCREVLNLLIRVEEPYKDTTDPIDILNRFKTWKYPPLNEIESVILKNKLAIDYEYSYGPRLFNFNKKVNQIEDFVIPLLSADRTSRRGSVSLWDPNEDCSLVKKNIPSLMVIDFKLRNNKLNMTAVIRSNDMFFGWPANVYQLFVLQSYIAKKLKCEVGSLDTFSNSAHIFEDQFKYIQEILG